MNLDTLLKHQLGPNERRATYARENESEVDVTYLDPVVERWLRLEKLN